LLPTIGDLICYPEEVGPISLGDLSSLREEIAQESSELSLPAARQLRRLLDDYVAADGDQAEQVLSTILASIIDDAGEGSSMIIQGPVRSGKSHMLAATALLLEYPAAWPIFLDSHPQFEPLHHKVEQAQPLLVVPLPLGEHRGDQEHLEDIIFDRTAQELARPKYEVTIPLSQQSYALELIERHVVPRYGEQLNERARQHVGGYTTWEQLRRREPDEAIAAAQQVAHMAH